MLLGQQCGGRKDRHLLAIGHRDERSAQRDFGLAKSHIAADQAVHRPARAHVVDHIANRGGLIAGLFKAEAFGEGVVIVFLETEGMALARGAARVEVEQFGGGVAHLQGSFALGFLPLSAAEAVQGRLLFARTRVAADDRERRHRHVQLGLVGVLQMQKLGDAIAEIHVDEAEIAADAVLSVHDRVADFELGQILEHAVDIGLALFLAARACARRLGVELGFSDDREGLRRVAVDEAARQGLRRDHQARAGGQKVGERFARHRVHIGFAQILQHGFAPACRIGREQHAAVERVDEVAQRRDRVICAAVDGDGRQTPRHACGSRLAIRTVFAAPQRRRRKRSRIDKKRLPVEINRVRRKQGPDRVFLQKAVALLQFFPERRERLIDPAMRDQQRICGQIVKQGLGVLEKQRQVILDAGRRHAIGHVLVHRKARRVALKHLTKTPAKRSARFFIERKLAPRQQANLAYRINRALRIDVKGLDRLDVGAKQVDAIRHRTAHRKQIDQTAARCPLAGADHLLHVGVARHVKLRTQGGFVKLVTDLDEEGARHDVLRRRQALQRRAGGHQQYIDLAARDQVERLQPLGDQVLVWRDGVVRQGLPIGQHVGAQLRRKPPDLVLQTLRIVRIGAHDGEHAELLLDAPARQAREQQRVARALGQGEAGALAGLETGAEQVRGMGHAGKWINAGATNAKRAAKTRGAYNVLLH